MVRHEAGDAFHFHCLRCRGHHRHRIFHLAHIPFRILPQRLCRRRRNYNEHVENHRLDVYLLRNLHTTRNHPFGNPYLMVPFQFGVCEYLVDLAVGHCGDEDRNHGGYRVEISLGHIWRGYGGQSDSDSFCDRVVEEVRIAIAPRNINMGLEMATTVMNIKVVALLE